MIPAKRKPFAIITLWLEAVKEAINKLMPNQVLAIDQITIRRLSSYWLSVDDRPCSIVMSSGSSTRHEASLFHHGWG
jgi:hypothetical protein